MSGGVIQGTFLGGRPKLAMPAAQPPAMPRPPGPPPPAPVAQPRMARASGAPMPAAQPSAMPRKPGPPAPAHVVQPRAPQAQPRSAQPQAPGGAAAVDPALLRAAGRPGQPLPESVQSKMEQAFSADFSTVRVHEGPQAESIGAIAFTVGSDIYFAPGRFQPHSAAGQQLLGHELAHVLQQRAGRVRNPLGSGLAVVQDHALEAEADRMGHRAAAQMMPAAATAQKTVQPAAQRKADAHKLVVGTYLHRGQGATGLPAEAAGHTFVAIEAPGGRREAYGFSPADPQRYDFQRDIGQLRAGVPGAVQREDDAFAKPGVRTRTYDVSQEQARAALAKVAEYKTRAPAFSFAHRDCGRFAGEVLRAAKIDDFAGPGVRRPAELYRRVQVSDIAAAQAREADIPPAGHRPLAPHVQAAVSAVGQPKHSPVQLSTLRSVAAHMAIGRVGPTKSIQMATESLCTQYPKLEPIEGARTRARMTLVLKKTLLLVSRTGERREITASESIDSPTFRNGGHRDQIWLWGGGIETRLNDAEAKAYRWLRETLLRIKKFESAKVYLHSTQGQCDSCADIRHEVIQWVQNSFGASIEINMLSDLERRDVPFPNDDKLAWYGHAKCNRVRTGHDQFGHDQFGYETRHGDASPRGSRRSSSSLSAAPSTSSAPRPSTTRASNIQGPRREQSSTSSTSSSAPPPRT